jgi:hypothetical protein
MTALANDNRRSCPNPQERRALVAGWFSYPRNFATAGDVMARDVACDWLTEAGVCFDVANAPPFDGGVDWQTVDPSRYTDLVFVCGPVWFGHKSELLRRPRIANALLDLAPKLSRLGLDPVTRFPLELLLHRFSHARSIGLDLTVIGTMSANPFDTLIERDSPLTVRPDLAYVARQPLVPVIGVVLVEPGSEYARGPQRDAEQAIATLIRGSGAAPVSIDTRLDVKNEGGLTSAAQIESLIAQMSCVVTTRMHGFILAIRNGVPALAIDPHPGGRKIRRQAELIGWPHVFTADALDDVLLRHALDACLSESGRAQARECRTRALQLTTAVRGEFISALRV